MKRIVLICFGLLAAVWLLRTCRCTPKRCRQKFMKTAAQTASERRCPRKRASCSTKPAFRRSRAGRAMRWGSFPTLADGVRESFTEPLRALVLLLAVVVLCRIVAELASDGLTHTVGLCAALGAAGVLLPPLAGLIGKASAVTEAIGVFLLAAVPVYAGLLVTAGNAVTGATYGALTLAAANGVSALTVNLFVPLLRVFLCAFGPSRPSRRLFDLKKLTDALYKLLKWALVSAVTVFTGILSVQTLVSAQSDARDRQGSQDDRFQRDPDRRRRLRRCVFGARREHRHDQIRRRRVRDSRFSRDFPAALSAGRGLARRLLSVFACGRAVQPVEARRLSGRLCDGAEASACGGFQYRRGLSSCRRRSCSACEVPMREVYTLVLSVCAVLLGVEILARLFPEKSGTLVHALAVLAVVVTMVGGLLHLDPDFSAVRSDFTPEQSAEDSEALYAETGTALLRERQSSAASRCWKLRASRLSKTSRAWRSGTRSRTTARLRSTACACG